MSTIQEPAAASARQALAASADRRLKIVGKLKSALDLMVWGAEDGRPLAYDDAARTANLTVRSMRRALERPHVRAYLRTQREVFRASISARVIFRLDELAHQNENRNAAVSASRAILQMEDEAETRRPSEPMTPGLIIVVAAAAHPSAPRTIEHDVERLPPTE
jgi:hypothetical protein